MTREFPITGLVEGWYFRQREVSMGCWIVEASDVYGRMISRQTSGDPNEALKECVEFARQTVAQNSTQIYGEPLTKDEIDDAGRVAFRNLDEGENQSNAL